MGIDKKISELSTIPEWAIDKLHKYIDLIHSHDVVEQVLDNQDVLKLEIWEGTLYLKLEDDNIKYKFVPNEEFNNVIVNSVKKKESKLITDVTDKLKKAITNTYKDII